MKRTITYIVITILSISFALMSFGREVEPNIHNLSSFSLAKTSSVVAKQIVSDTEKQLEEEKKAAKEKAEKEKAKRLAEEQAEKEALAKQQEEQQQKEIEEQKKKEEEAKKKEEQAAIEKAKKEKAEKEKARAKQEAEEKKQAEEKAAKAKKEKEQAKKEEKPQKTTTVSDVKTEVILPSQEEENTILDSVTTKTFRDSIYKNLTVKSKVNKSEQLENAIIYASNKNSDLSSLDETRGLNAKQTNLTYYAFDISEESLQRIADQVPYNVPSAKTCGISIKVQQEESLFLVSITIATK